MINSMATDPRTTPGNGRVAHSSLKGRVQADKFTDGTPWQVKNRVADLQSYPDGPRGKQMLYGHTFIVLETHDGYAFGYDPYDGYVGYTPHSRLTQGAAKTHYVCARMTLVYQNPDVKSDSCGHLGMGSRVMITQTDKLFCQTDDGFWIFKSHLCPLADVQSDPIEIAGRLLGAPYLWGGNSCDGIDCSGLTQMALSLCGITCPRDSDQQHRFFPIASPPYGRGDLVFWQGHVGLLVDENTLIHANAYHMNTAIEPFSAARERIAQKEFGDITKVARPAK